MRARFEAQKEVCAAVGTWPGLCVVFVDYAAGEISSSAGKKRGPDVNIAKTLRHLVQLADDDRRSGTKMSVSYKQTTC